MIYFLWLEYLAYLKSILSKPRFKFCKKELGIAYRQIHFYLKKPHKPSDLN